MSKSKLTTAERLSKIKYLYYIPAMYHKSISEHQTCGSFSSGDPALDKTLMAQPVLINGSVFAMVDHFEEGVPITLHNPKDALTIYKDIRKLLGLWLDASLREHNLKVPMEELKKLDEFAKPMAEIARRYEPNLATNSTCSDLEKTLSGYFNSRPNKKPIPEKKPEKQYTHNPFIASIKANLNDRGIEWN